MVCKNLCFAYVRKVFPVFSAEHPLSHVVQKSSFCLCAQGFSGFFSRASAQLWCAKNLAFAYVRKVFLVFSVEHLLSHGNLVFAYVRKVFLVFSAEHLVSHGVQTSNYCLCTQGFFHFYQPSIRSAMVFKNHLFAYVRKVFPIVFSRASAQPWCAKI